MNNKEKLLKQVNLDIIFFFLLLVSSGVNFYIINEKKKSILNIDCIDNNTANKTYYYNRRLAVIIATYFFLNAYKSYKENKGKGSRKQEEFLLIATFFNLLGALAYLPLGNSNVIIEN